MSITELWLSTWFVDSYLHKSAQLCPDRISWLFEDVSTSRVSVVVDWRPDSMLPELQHVSLIAECLRHILRPCGHVVV